MSRKISKRVASVLLALVFFVFNVGVPVIVDSCPMPKSARSACCPLCQASAVHGKGSAVGSIPCCTSTIAAEKNSTEFLQVQKLQVLTEKFVSLSPAPYGALQRLAAGGRPLYLMYEPSPPLSVDLPILYSSLLI
ncbi:MAG TPA: hypothetical protein VL126_02110 [Bacteroidota bacterium]|nr:hypothetical protein [Bacteroidota bacterium]